MKKYHILSEMNEYLLKNWQMLTKHALNPGLSFYDQLITSYSSPTRHYHNLKHIQDLLELTDLYKDNLFSPETVSFAVWYHDAIFDPLDTENEERSAELAQQQLSALHIDPTIISHCYSYILATKTHSLSEHINHFDAQFMLDIDLSILAANRHAYQKYQLQIRQEYHMFSDEAFKKGRKKLLNEWLSLDHIFHTDLFRNEYEEKARENISIELAFL